MTAVTTGSGSAVAAANSRVLFDLIGISNFVNLILVKEDIRPAFLLQPANYGEATGKGMITSSILREIQKAFPDLKQSENYTRYQGILISKMSFDGREDISLTEMGRILGYPCFSDFMEKDLPAELSLHVKGEKISSGKEFTSLLFVNRCKDDSKKTAFEAIAAHANAALAKPENKELLRGFDIRVTSVFVKSEVIHNEMRFLEKLATRESFNEDEKHSVLNFLYNLGFSFEVLTEFEDNFQYSNPVHRGILMSLLLNSKFNVISPFFPLHEQKESVVTAVEEITADWGRELIVTILATKAASRVGVKNSRKARTRT